jgi:hypothetical protein
MLEWLPDLDPVFDSAVDRVCLGQPATSEHGLVFYSLAKEGLATRYPDAVHRLLNHLLPAAKRPFYSCQYAEDLVRTIRGAGMATQALRPLCDALARLDCDGARLWREIQEPR